MPSDATAASRRVAWAAAATSLLLHLAVGWRYGFHRDELYLLVCGRRPFFVTPDHAPLVPALGGLVQALLGASPLAQRLPDMLFGAATVFVTARLAGRLGGGNRAQALAAIAVGAAPVFFYAAGVHGTMAPDQLASAVLGWLAIAGLPGLPSSPPPQESPATAAPAQPTPERPTAVGWVVAGAAAAIGVLAKPTVALDAAALLAARLSLRAGRRASAWPAVVTGMAVFAALLAPWLLAQAAAGAPMLAFVRASRAAVHARTSWATFLLDQPVNLHPAGIALALVGLHHGLGSGASDGARLAARQALIAAAVLYVVGGKGYYLAPAYPLLLASAAAKLDGTLRRLSARRLREAAGLAAAAYSVALAGTLPVLPAGLSVRLGLTRFNPALAQFLDWEGLTAELAAMGAAAGARSPLVLTSSYGTAAAVVVFGARHGLPDAASGANGFFLWGPPTRAADPLLAVGIDATWLRRLCSELALAGILGRDAEENRFDVPRPVYVCRGLRQPLTAMWPALRTYD